MNQETSTPSDSTAQPVELKPGITDQAPAAPKIKLNRVQLRSAIARARKAARRSKIDLTPKQRLAKRAKRKVQRASRKRNRK